MFFLSLLIIGLAGYVTFASHGIRYIFAHVGGLGVLGLLGCWAVFIAKKKGYSDLKALLLGFVLPIGLGVISVGIVYALGGHGCGGIVSLSVALAVIAFYLLVKSRGYVRKIGSDVKS